MQPILPNHHRPSRKPRELGAGALSIHGHGKETDKGRGEIMHFLRVRWHTLTIFLTAMAWATNAQAAVITLDDFNDGVVDAAWIRPDVSFGAVLHETGGVVNLVNSSTPGIVYRRWSGLAPYDSNWSVRVDLNISDWSGPIVPNMQTSLALRVSDASEDDGGFKDWLSVGMSSSPSDVALFGFPPRLRNAIFSRNFTQTDATGGLRLLPFGGTSATVRVSFDSLLKTLTFEHDIDGDITLDNFVTAGVINVKEGALPGRPGFSTAWSMPEDGKFQLALVASSRNMEIPNGFAHFDNLRSDSFVVKVPAPASFALGSFALLGALATMRLRRHSTLKDGNARR